MPHKDPEKRKQYMAEYGARWYQAHREEVIEKVKERKHTVYAGVCKNCGGPTVGPSKGKAAKYCSKPECRSAHFRNDPKYRAAGLQGFKYQREMKRWTKRKPAVNLDELQLELENKPKRRS